VRRAAFAALALLASVATAAADGGVPTPAIPKAAEGQHCVRDTAFMRRYHMTMLYQQRDAVVHQGDRSGDFSIERCVSCHAVKGADGKPVTYADPHHFCRTCHDYEAVKVDCFDCHRSTPMAPEKAASGDLDRAYATLGDYLKGMAP
jgi:predicted CXXCH cytochrome family protein